MVARYRYSVVRTVLLTPMLPTLFKPTSHDATQPPFIDANHPEYYTELLSNGVRTERTDPRRLLPDEQHTCPAIPGVDDALSRRLQTLLDVLADISLSLHEREKNVSATMASLTVNRGTPETQLYIVFNRGLGDDGIHRCRHHLETIFNMLQQVPYDSSATDGSPKTIARSLETYLLDLCKVIHEYSILIRCICVSRQEAREEAFGDSGVHQSGSDETLRLPGTFRVGDILSACGHDLERRQGAGHETISPKQYETVPKHLFILDKT
jgi:hypothetical protein